MVSSAVKSWIIFPVLVVGGIGVGLMLPLQQIRNSVAAIFELEPDDHAEDEESDASDLHVDITESAQKSLGLIVRRATIGHHISTYDIPARIVTLPGAESLRLSSRFDGMVKRVFVSEGQSVRAGDPLLEIELTGERLSKAQSDLLLAIRKNENLVVELKRLEPLVQQGGLANKRYLELVYEQKQLLVDIDTRKQELLLLGLGEEQIESIVKTKRLVRSLIIPVPKNLLPPQINISWEAEAVEQQTFIVESFAAKTGTMVQSGSDFGVLSFHEVLVVEGHAFERDLATIRMLMADTSNVGISVGKLSDETHIANCKVAYIGNHAKGDSNTFPFFVYLKNKLVGPKPSSETPGYFSWRWKPGQLGHVEIPKNSFADMLIIPRDAIAEDGVSKMVFEWKGQVAHDHGPDEEVDDYDHEHADEFVPIEISVVYMDDDVAVVDPGGKLKEGTKIAYNCANQLLFAMQSGSGGHGHSHPHPH